LNTAEALLEYKLSSALHKITLDSFPTIAYLVGNGQPDNYQIYDAINTIRSNYPLQVLDIDSIPFIPSQVNAIIINKPTFPFSEQQKLKIDQYIMHGGKVIWMLDALYASLDSLQRSEGSFIAFDRGLNLEDQLFKYGVRINQDLVQDLHCDKIPSVYGTMGGKPQIQLLPWPYFPLLGNGDAHPISKNLDYVLSQFPGSIDTVKSPGVRKTILLSTSTESRILSTPAKVEWASVRNEEDMKTFTRSNVPVAVLLEGKFNSPFANRLSLAQADTLSKIFGRPFLSESTSENQMIVISDGDIISNAVTQNEGPLMMGMNQYTQYQYANRDFFLNCLEFLTDNSGILETRSKDYALRLLDARKVEEGRSRWQFMAIALPVLLVLVLGLLWQWLRKRKYALRST
jgi:ABC-2 type transport system permease protein